jgi:diaminopimelate epimerase
MIPFRKMNGLGNDFLVVDARGGRVRPAPEIIRRLADRKSGVGFDQFITIEATKSGADAFMRIDNADGGEVEACGNATRCVGWLLMRESGRESAAIETVAGLLNARPGGHWPQTSNVVMPGLDPGIHSTPRDGTRDSDGMDRRVRPGDDDRGSVGGSEGPSAPTAKLIAVDMGVPRRRVGARSRPLRAAAGKPPDLSGARQHLARAGDSGGRDHPANLGARGRADARLRHRRLRRARLRRAHAPHGAERQSATVTLPGGALQIEWDAHDHVWMTGPAELEFSGRFDPETGAFTRDGVAA